MCGNRVIELAIEAKTARPEKNKKETINRSRLMILLGTVSDTTSSQILHGSGLVIERSGGRMTGVGKLVLGGRD